MTILDLNKFPQISNMTGLLKYDPFLEFPELKNLGEISERIYGCNYFNGAKSDEKYPNFCENANFRAAVNEFISISEIISKIKPELAIEKTDFPLFHFFKELRVTTFHIMSFTSHKIKSKAFVVNSNIEIDHSQEVDTELFIIQNCNLELFAKNNNFIKHYNSSDFKTTVQWVNDKQNVWGITKILENALQQYCNLILKYCA